MNIGTASPAATDEVVVFGWLVGGNTTQFDSAKKHISQILRDDHPLHFHLPRPPVSNASRGVSERPHSSQASPLYVIALSRSTQHGVFALFVCRAKNVASGLEREH
jgi:hypothetical protein